MVCHGAVGPAPFNRDRHGAVAVSTPKAKRQLHNKSKPNERVFLLQFSLSKIVTFAKQLAAQNLKDTRKKKKPLNKRGSASLANMINKSNTNMPPASIFV